jgi:hypothetical protein
MLQIKLSAAHSVRIPAGEVQRSNPIRPPRACCPFGEGGYGREEQTSQLHTCLEGTAIQVRDFLERVGGNLGGDHQVEGCGLAATVLTLAAAFFGLPSRRLGGCCRFQMGRLRPRRLPGGGYFRLLGCLRDRVRDYD